MWRTLLQVCSLLIVAILESSCGGGRSTIPASAPHSTVPTPTLLRTLYRVVNGGDRMTTIGIEYERTDIGTACNQHFSIAQPRRSVKGAIARHVCTCEETFVASSKQDCQGEGIRTEEVSGGAADKRREFTTREEHPTILEQCRPKPKGLGPSCRRWRKRGSCGVKQISQSGTIDLRAPRQKNFAIFQQGCYMSHPGGDHGLCRSKHSPLGLKSSAFAVPPPATSTLPLPSKVAVCPTRGVAMLPVRVKVPVAGLKSSAVARVPVAFVPPVTRTLPLASLVAVCLRRANSILPVAVKWPAAAHATASARTANSVSERKRNVLDFILPPA